MLRQISKCLLPALGVLCLASGVNAAEPVTRHYDGVLGTSLDITVYGATESEVLSAIDMAVEEIAGLEQVLSTYREDSDLMRLNRSGHIETASPALLDVVELCETWWERANGKFSCRLGTVISLWEEAEQSQVVPERPDIRHTARAAITGAITLDRSTATISMDPAISLDPSGLAKGYIIDRALEVLRYEVPAASAIKVDIGGDATYWGVPPGSDGWRVGVADPVTTADNTRYVTTLGVQTVAIAASGHFSRQREIGRRSFSHILQPRDGWPVDSGTASVVLAADATTADAVATALAVLPLVDGIEWVDGMAGVEALVIDSAGRQMSSANWHRFTGAGNEGAATGNESRLDLSFSLPEFSEGSYYRPYVAIWITDPDNKTLKNLLLLGETERWARENARWWRRVGRRNPELLDGVARPTRGPGEYQLEWDGMDDFGEQLGAGDYVLHLEASRESGGSSYQTMPFTLGSPDRQTLEPDGEFGSISLTIH